MELWIQVVPVLLLLQQVTTQLGTVTAKKKLESRNCQFTLEPVYFFQLSFRGKCILDYYTLYCCSQVILYKKKKSNHLLFFRVPLTPEMREVLEVAYVSKIMSKNFRKEGQPEKERIARITGMDIDKVCLNQIEWNPS